MKPVTSSKSYRSQRPAATPLSPAVPGCTYDEISAWQLTALSDALGLENTHENVALQRSLFEPWGSQLVPPDPSYPSCIGDDHSPYEYSLAFSPNALELRILFEAQAENPDPSSVQVAALGANERLRRQFGVDLERFDAIANLFLPEEPSPPFSLWHAVCLNQGLAPEFKIYLNPQAHGKASAQSVILEALGRLGFSSSARKLFTAVARRGPQLDEVRYFSLDLSARQDARVKVYFAHHGVSAKELERAFAFAPGHVSGDVERYCKTLAGHTGPFRRKPLTSCFSFVTNRDAPLAATLHYPIAHYENDDESVAHRVASYLSSHGLNAALYRRGLAALARRPLGDGVGSQSSASYRREASGIRFTAYLSPELFRGASSGVNRVA